MMPLGASIRVSAPTVAGQPPVSWLGITAADSDTFKGVADRFGVSREALHSINLGLVLGLPRLLSSWLDGFKIPAGTLVALEPSFLSDELLEVILDGLADPHQREEPSHWCRPPATSLSQGAPATPDRAAWPSLIQAAAQPAGQLCAQQGQLFGPALQPWGLPAAQLGPGGGLRVPCWSCLRKMAILRGCPRSGTPDLCALCPPPPPPNPTPPSQPWP